MLKIDSDLNECILFLKTGIALHYKDLGRLYLGIYSRVPNRRTGSNKRTGCEICQKLINEQDLISAQARVFDGNQ